jgi:hypothetical protein
MCDACRFPDVSGVQGQIGAETAARQAADTGLENRLDAEAASRLGMAAVLLQSIQQESAERKAADDGLRSTVSEASIVGSYAFTGTVLCLTSSNNFAGDLTPTAPALDGPSTVTTVFNGVSSGIRTF